jgi:hypothetical protein
MATSIWIVYGFYLYQSRKKKKKSIVAEGAERNKEGGLDKKPVLRYS